jgi:TolB-like protein
VNLSYDKEQEFFSDGMTEELTSALAKIPDLVVIGRTSAFQFKGKAEDLRAIGQALNANYLIEGSVRRAQDRVRITAQLIRADSGAHLWTENYDRNLTDVFAIQEDIAQAIASSLRVPLGLKQGETLVSNRTNDLESYQQYLRARALYRARNVSDAIAILEPLVAHNPDFAPAWGLLAEAYASAPTYDPGPLMVTLPVEEAHRLVQADLDKMEMVAKQAIKLDPRHAGGYAALASIQGPRLQWAIGDDLFRQALALDPDDPDALEFYGLYLADTGRLKQALTNQENLRRLEPFVPVYHILTAYIMELNGERQAAISEYEAIPPSGATANLRATYLAIAYAGAGRYKDAADTILAITPGRLSRKSIEDAARIMRTAPAKLSAPESLPQLGGRLGMLYGFVGAPDRVFEVPERSLEIGRGFSSTIWDPVFSSSRKTERFKALVRKAGLVDYWKARGWPDLCHPTVGDDFECD